MTGQPILAVENLSMRFGGVVAVDGVSFGARERDITAIIGPNGAGKTTIFNCLTGFYRPSGGSLSVTRASKTFRLERLPGHRIVRDAGVVRTFQNVRLFAGMTVLENLIVAQHAELTRASFYNFGGLLGLKRHREAERAAINRAYEWLSLIELAERADEAAGNLPYGAQRRLEIVRAMCTGPQLLCLDEPAAGLNPHESADLARFLVSIRDRFSIGILLIEHDMSVVMGISDHVIVLNYGQKIADGAPSDIRHDPAVIAAYLGEEEHT